MRQIRSRIFETNSSSTHSLTIDEWKEIDEYNFDPIFKLREDYYYFSEEERKQIKTLSPQFLEFGWSEPYFEGNRSSFKLSYLITLIAQEKHREDDDRIQGKEYLDEKERCWKYSDAYEALKEDVNRVCSELKISVDWPLMKEPTKDDKWYNLNGSIDHQSYDFARKLVKYLFVWASDHYYGDPVPREVREDFDNRLRNYLFDPRVKLDISSDG